MRIYNPTGRNTQARVVDTYRGSFYFSYQTCIAIDGWVGEERIRARLANHWGPTTGRHFNELGCYDLPIVSDEEFHALMHRLEQALDLTVIREGQE